MLEAPHADLVAKLQPFSSRAIRTGDNVRLEIPSDKDLNHVLEIVLREGGKIASLNPLKMSLEDYFLSTVSDATEQARRGRNVDIRLEGKP